VTTPVRAPARLSSPSLALAAAALLGGALPARGQIVFEPPVTSDAGSPAISAVVGDLDEDGLPDAIVNHLFITPPPALMLGAGDGSFDAAPTTLAERARRLVDFNGDGHLDLLGIAGSFTLPPNNVTVRLGLGNGSFAPKVDLPSTSAAPMGIVAADFDEDGDDDVAVTMSNVDGAAVIESHGDLSFDPVAVRYGTLRHPGDASFTRAY